MHHRTPLLLLVVLPHCYGGVAVVDVQYVGVSAQLGAVYLCRGGQSPHVLGTQLPR